MKTCDVCGSVKQVVSGDTFGNLCVVHYPAAKRGKAHAQTVSLRTCSNCGSQTIIRDRCIQCGNTLTQDGSVMRIGGHDDC